MSARGGRGCGSNRVMRQHRDLSKGAQRTSNVKDHEALAAWRQRSFERQNHAVGKLRSSFHHRLHALLTDDAVKAGAAVTEKYRQEWAQSLLTTMGRPDEMAGVRQRLRAAAEQSLRRELADYDAIRALQAEYAHDYRTVVDANFHYTGGLTVFPWDWAETVDNFGMEVFEPPFEVSDLSPFPDDGSIDASLSTTVPSLGYVLNDIAWRDDNTFWESSDEDLYASNDVAVGINFRAPRTSFLNIAVDMRNLFNWIHVSGTDNYGFSSADVNVTHSVFILVLRGDRRIQSFHEVVSNGWVQHSGDDFGFLFPPIPEGPVVFVANIEDALHNQEQVQILGGCQTYVRGDVTNMDCRAGAKMLWQLQKLYVWLTD
jgi:hypothetical protein